MGSVKRVAKRILRSQNVPFSDEIVDAVAGIVPAFAKQARTAHTRGGSVRHKAKYFGPSNVLGRNPVYKSYTGKLRLGPIGKINKAFRKVRYGKNRRSSNRKALFKKKNKAFAKRRFRRYRKSYS